MAAKQETFAEVVRLLIQRRKALGLSQQELNARIGVTTDLVAKWEVGLRRPRGFELWCWALALGCNLTLEEHSNENSRSNHVLGSVVRLQGEGEAQGETKGNHRPYRDQWSNDEPSTLQMSARPNQRDYGMHVPAGQDRRAEEVRAVNGRDRTRKHRVGIVG